ncbi:permease [Clostridium acetobutylicum]|nr:permease [Clostridium acetobutylicum]
MTLCKMALRNVKSNFRNFWAYFLSTSFSVFVIYIFIAIAYNKNVQDSLGTMKSVKIIFNMGTVLIIIFSTFFIWYSNSFLTKARKKEFATYMLLGMSKEQVAWLNFIENFIIMIVAFLTGIIFGVVFNKVFVMLLFALMRTAGRAVFQFSFKAFEISSIVFLVIFLIISLQSYLIICKSKLIDMFNAAKKIEKGLKISFITLVMSIIAVICIGYGYYIAIKKLGYKISLSPEAVLLISVGTILFFSAIIAVVIDLMKKNHRYIFKGSRLITVSQIHQRYRGNVGSLSVITITTTIALCALLFCFGGFSKAIENARNLSPLSVEYINGNSNVDNTFNNIVEKHKEVNIDHKVNMKFIVVSARLPFYNQDSNTFVINQSEFNKIRSYENFDGKVNLKDNECFYYQIQVFNGNPKDVIDKKAKFKFGSMDYSLRVKDTDDKCFISLDHSKNTIVVSDKVYNRMKKEANNESFFNITGYKLKNDFKADKFVDELQKEMPKENSLTTFYEHYTSGMKLMGIMGFIGLFIGILFIMATGSIIYFKMYMESREDRKNFITLRKVGVSNNEITKSIAKELLVLFGAPFVLATLNCYAASFSISKILDLKIIKTYIVIELAYLLIYSIYYFLTLKTYIRNIKE